MNRPKAVKARHSQTGSTLVASTHQGSASKSNERLTRKQRRSPNNEEEGLLANTARAIGSMVGKFVAKTSGGMSTTAKKAMSKVAAGQGSTKKALRRSGRRSVARDSKGQFKKSNDVDRSAGRGAKQNARLKVRAGQRDQGHPQRTKITDSKLKLR